MDRSNYPNDMDKVEAVPNRVSDMPERLRPREALERMGVEHVSDDVLIAILLRTGIPGLNVAELSRHLLRRFGSLTALAKASVEDLAACRGMGPVKAQVLASALELARRLSQESLPDKPSLRSPQDVYEVMKELARPRQEEVFWVLFLDTRHRLIRPPFEMSKGIIDASLVHSREVFREAIACSSSGVILAHNHPSGDPTPSQDDIRVTRQLVDAGRIVDIRVLDHVVIGAVSASRAKGYSSLRELGLVSFSA